jgi:uncharacterized protein YndB with AHSA1/START domain
MARNEIFISAPPREVFELLADPRTYGHWVVGSREIHAADAHWPEPGAVFQHTVGKGPFAISDHTTVIAARAPVMLQLRARARPLPSARVTMLLQPEGPGTRVTMIEAPPNRLLSLLSGPIGHALLRVRNRESLLRLKELAEGTAERPRGRLARSGSKGQDAIGERAAERVSG